VGKEKGWDRLIYPVNSINEGAPTAAMAYLWRFLSLAIAGLLLPQQIFLPAICSVTIVFLIFEFIRLRFPQINQRFLTCFHVLLRERETATLTASAYFLIAASVVFILCDKSIAAIALTFVAVGDPVAGMVGEKWGRLKARGRSLEGNCSCFLACAVAGIILATITHVALWLAVVGAVRAALVEFLSFPVNDNLTIPLVSAGVMSLVKLLCF